MRLPAARSGIALAVVTGAGLAAGVLGAGWAPAMAGHEVGFYPSYYPHEIRLETMEPAQAASLFAEKRLHAYIGAAPADAGRLPDDMKAVDSLGSFLVLDVNRDSPAFGSGEARCAAVRGVRAALRGGGPGFVFHPYPVTPYHADYLHHLDRIEEARAASDAGEPAADLEVRAKGRRAAALVQARWGSASEDWDVSLEEIPVEDLIADAGVQLDAWLGPPWIKEGWFQAYRLLAPAIADAADREAAHSLYSRLVRGDYLGLAEQVGLERRLLEALRRGCGRTVVGYTVDREFYSDDFASGIENIAYDSLTGMNTPVFIRTVKLKDFPWNGELDLGMRERPEAAWNPVAGFTDAPGRLIWSALGDPALMPMPYNASWIPNRLDFTITRAEGQSGGIRIPADSVLPEPGGGAFRPVADPSFASTKLVYTVSASPFSDGTDTEVADLLYAFAMAYRWGARSDDPDDDAFDPHLAAAVADVRGRLAGVRALRVDQAVNRIAPDVQVVQKKPVLEVYLRDTPGDAQQAAALAPPWSTVPWHLMALMEEAVLRGHAAFSQAEAARRGVPWLDLARDASLHARMLALIEEFEAAAYRPAALRDLVSEDDARARWRALREFAEDNGHLLVTNGPYRLKEWQTGPVVLGAVREATYPMGFGTFDQYVLPLRAVVREVTRDAGHVTVRAEAEKTVKVGRSYQTETVPLNHETGRGIYGALVVSRYLLIGTDGAVVGAGKMDWQDDGRFEVALPEDLPPGRYRVLVAVYLDGNSLKPSTGTLRFETGG